MKKKLFIFSLICALFVSILGTVGHFFYEWSGRNHLVGYFFPVNESTWEHMKLFFFPSFICYIILCFLKQTKELCIVYVFPKTIFIGTFLIPVLFYTYSGILGYTIMIIDIAIFYISTFFSFFILYKDCTSRKKINYSVPFNIGLFLLLFCFIFFTYAPPNIAIFDNPLKEK